MDMNEPINKCAIKNKLKVGEYLICDPCYIEMVEGTFRAEPRFDALRCVKVLHEGDDGSYAVEYKNEKGEHEDMVLGVDSGRLWLMRAEFDVDVRIDSGLSGHAIIKNPKLDIDTVELL